MFLKGFNPGDLPYSGKPVSVAAEHQHPIADDAAETSGKKHGDQMPVPKSERGLLLNPRLAPINEKIAFEAEESESDLNKKTK